MKTLSIKSSIVLCCLIILNTATVFGSEPAVENIYNALKDRVEGLDRDQIMPSKVEGLYTVTIGFDVYYMSSNGKYLFSGDVIELATGNKVDGSGMAEKRKRMIATVADEDLIIYPVVSEKQTSISIFTDTTCPYCRKLHEQMPALTKAGIEVRYLAFPRAGAQSQVAIDMASIWCAEDKPAAMTASKQGRPVEPAECDDPVAAQHRLGVDMQIRGTPAIILENGEIIAGYLPADTLIQRSMAAIE